MVSYWSQIPDFLNVENNSGPYVKSELIHIRNISLDLILNLAEVSIVLGFMKIRFHWNACL